jgi:phage tail-like protein
MATLRDRPYTNFNFLVDLGDETTGSAQGGFEEVYLPEVWVDVIEYRNGNDKENTIRKITGLDHCGNLVLKRGLVGSLNLYSWYDQVRNGDESALRTVTIQLQSEDHSEVVMTWKLLNARIVRFKCGPLNGKGKDVTVEYAELAAERLEMA